jgi:hypothetical protein
LRRPNALRPKRAKVKDAILTSSADIALVPRRA